MYARISSTAESLRVRNRRESFFADWNITLAFDD
jgi:hypothetical protein